MIADAIFAANQKDMSANVTDAFNQESNAFSEDKNHMNSSVDLYAHFFVCKIWMIHKKSKATGPGLSI